MCSFWQNLSILVFLKCLFHNCIPNKMTKFFSGLVCPVRNPHHNFHKPRILTFCSRGIIKPCSSAGTSFQPICPFQTILCPFQRNLIRLKMFFIRGTFFHYNFWRTRMCQYIRVSLYKITAQQCVILWGSHIICICR